MVKRHNSHLILDIGNSRTKLAIFKDSELVRHDVFDELTLKDLEEFSGSDNPVYGMVSATGTLSPEIRSWLDRNITWFELDHNFPLPFSNDYKTPETLGRDRIAGIAGALALGFSPPLMVIDAGTCMTIDYLNKEYRYLGGSISPGINMRLEAMHSMTDRLPLVRQDANAPYPGTDTRTSLLAGAQWGCIHEIQGAIHRFKGEFGKFNIIITGGDHLFLSKSMKRKIFADRDLVLRGLDFLLNKQLDAI